MASGRTIVNRDLTAQQRKSLRHQIESPVIRIPHRKIGNKQTLLLYVQAGGRCEFWGCNKYLLKHSVTQAVDNFGEIAHIVAFSKAGPRGKTQPCPSDIHDLSNLMLLCDECHKLIDRRPDEYPVSVLREYKQQHEENVYHAIGIRRSLRTAIVCLEAPINGKQAAIPMPQIHKAILPRRPLERPRCLIELNQQSAISDGPEFLDAAAKTIEARIREFHTPGLPSERIEHVSVFGLASIPLLVVLGHQLGNTIPADVYHHHHDTDDWSWKTSKHTRIFEHELVRTGKDIACVALLISVSGTITVSSLPKDIDERFYIYQIRPVKVRPSTNCLRTREDLENFKRTYEDLLRDLRYMHHSLDAINLFPAIPPPIAIVCGRELMPKVDPALRIYDFNKRQGGFMFSLEVNGNVG